MGQGEIACPKCKVPMQEGYLSEETRHGHWYEGRPRYFLGIPMFRWAKTQVPIKAYRCPSCGYLESYAR